jgi:uncharacterized protein (TIGR02246 family)
MRLSLLLAIVLVVASCSPRSAPPGTSSSAADVIAIRETYADFVRANLAGDVERQLSFLTNDAVFMPPGVPTVSGKAALRQRWAGRQGDEVLDEFTVEIDELVVVGELAYARVSGSERSHRRDGSATYADRHRALDILRREPDGRWRIARHIRNHAESTTGSNGGAGGTPAPD